MSLYDSLQERSVLEARLNKELLEAGENNATLTNKVLLLIHPSVL